MIQLRKNIRKRVFIKKTKIFNFMNKVYHINEEMTRVSRKKLKKVKTKGYQSALKSMTNKSIT